MGSSSSTTSNQGGQRRGGPSRTPSRTPQGKNQTTQRNNTPKETSVSKRQPRRGVIDEPMNKKRIRDNLRNATGEYDITTLISCMEEFKNHDLEDTGDYREATARLEFLKLRKEISDACVRRNAAVLNETLKRAQGSKHRQELKPNIETAQHILQGLGNSSQFKHSIPGINNKTISEIRRYPHPPPGVHETMIATYIIIGYPEKVLKDWSVITALMGRHGNESLQNETALADKKSVDRTAAATAKAYLSTHSLDFVRQQSNGASAFYVWASRKVGITTKR